MTNKHTPKCPSCERYKQYKPDASCANLEHWEYYRKKLDAHNFRRQQTRDVLKSWSKKSY